MNKKRYNMIDAGMHVSESEINLLAKDYDFTWFNEGNENRTLLLNLLHELGADTDKYIELQAPTHHRNRAGKVVFCGRYYGQERLDDEWLASGFASKAAKDKASGSKLLEEIYRQQGLTEDAQLAMEYKDKYKKEEE